MLHSYAAQSCCTVMLHGHAAISVLPSHALVLHHSLERGAHPGDDKGMVAEHGHPIGGGTRDDEGTHTLECSSNGGAKGVRTRVMMRAWLRGTATQSEEAPVMMRAHTLSSAQATGVRRGSAPG